MFGLCATPVCGSQHPADGGAQGRLSRRIETGCRADYKDCQPGPHGPRLNASASFRMSERFSDAGGLDRKTPMPVVLCTSLNGDQGPHLALLRDAGFECRMFDPNADRKIAAEYLEQLDGASAIIAGAEILNAEILEAAPQLRVISRTGVGYDAIDLEVCDQLGIAVTITPGVNHHAVAEHAVALLTGLARGFPRYDAGVRSGDWTRSPGTRIMGSTLGLVGLGRIGQALATRGIGLGMKVIAADPCAPQDFAAEFGIDLVSLDELYSRADYISLHAPATPQTENMINAASIAKMKDTAVLINTARGTLVNEDDLADALANGKLRAAGLDVYRSEPLPVSSRLTQLDNVFLSPHVAGLDESSHADMFAMAAQNIIALHRGDRPDDNLVNLRDVPNWTWFRHSD